MIRFFLFYNYLIDIKIYYLAYKVTLISYKLYIDML